jgi:hypothetical protein
MAVSNLWQAIAGTGEIISLPVDGRSIKARVPVLTTLAETEQWPDVAAVELVESDQMELV